MRRFVLTEALLQPRLDVVGWKWHGWQNILTIYREKNVSSQLVPPYILWYGLWHSKLQSPVAFNFVALGYFRPFSLLRFYRLVPCALFYFLLFATIVHSKCCGSCMPLILGSDFGSLAILRHQNRTRTYAHTHTRTRTHTHPHISILRGISEALSATGVLVMQRFEACVALWNIYVRTDVIFVRADEVTTLGWLKANWNVPKMHRRLQISSANISVKKSPGN